MVVAHRISGGVVGLLGFIMIRLVAVVYRFYSMKWVANGIHTGESSDG